MQPRSPVWVPHVCDARPHGSEGALEGLMAIFTGPARVTSSVGVPITASVSGNVKRSERTLPRLTTSRPDEGALTQVALPTPPSWRSHALVSIAEQFPAAVRITAWGTAVPLV